MGWSCKTEEKETSGGGSQHKAMHKTVKREKSEHAENEPCERSSDVYLHDGTVECGCGRPSGPRPVISANAFGPA